LNELKEQLDQIQYEETERFVVENAVLFADPTLFIAGSGVPEPVSVLFKALSGEWATEKNPSFAANVLRAMEYVVDRHADNLTTEAFWINCGYRLLNLLKKSGYGEEVETALEHVKAECVFDPFSTQKKRRGPVEPPKLIGKNDKKEHVKDSAEFMKRLGKVTSTAYFNILDGLFKKLEPLISNAVFDPQDENAKAKSAEGGATMRELLRLLESYEKQLATQKVDAKIQAHLFTTVSCYIDAFVFNELLRNTNNTSRFLQIKMGINIIENWYEQHAHQITFKFARQSADVCAIAHDSLIKDAEMKKAVCPDLTTEQVAYLLANLEGSKSHSNADVRTLLAAPNVTLVDENDNSLLDFEADGNEKAKQAKIPERYTKRQGLEFLK
jgi:hypothetical protein